MFERILEMVRKEFRQSFRDPRARVVMIVPPIMQLLIFGFAVNLDVEHVRTAWVDFDRTASSRDLRAAFAGSRYFHIVYEPKTERDVTNLLDHGRVDLVVRVERGFAADLMRGRTAKVQLLVDGTDSNTAAIVSGYSQRLLGEFGARELAQQRNRRLFAASMAAGVAIEPSVPRLDVRARVWFNPDLNSRDYFVPGVIAVVITVATLILTALAIVREKEIGTMEQLMVTPLRPVELMIGKTIPPAVVGMFDILLVTVMALLVFRIPLRGAPGLLFLGGAVYIMTTLGIGLFISTVSHTQQQAMMLSFFFTFPIMLLSGFAFPIANMPEPIQWITYLNPLRYFLEIVRGVFLKGIGLETLWPQFVAMILLGTTILGINSMRFHKRLE